MSVNVLTESRIPAEAISNNTAPEITLQEIWNAIAQDQFFPHFQPKVSLRGMQLVGAEALIRWQHSEHGLLSAASFLPLIADNYLFDDLTAVMLEKSVGQCRKWRRQGLDVQVSVNLAPDLLLAPGLADRIEAKIIEHGIEHQNLVIEVPEAALAHDIQTALDSLLQLRVRGFGLAIDDFGTGQCTREQLERIPATELKIDHRLLVGAAHQATVRAALKRGLDLARELNLKAVAEGVETREEWELINELGCDMAQGYFIAPPMQAEDLVAWKQVWSSDAVL